jgi:hypothetical protein
MNRTITTSPTMYMIWFIRSAPVRRLAKCQAHRRNLNLVPARCHNMDQSRSADLQHEDAD